MTRTGTTQPRLAAGEAMSNERILDVIASIILDADGRPFAPFVLARLRDAGYEVVQKTALKDIWDNGYAHGTRRP